MQRTNRIARLRGGINSDLILEAKCRRYIVHCAVATEADRAAALAECDARIARLTSALAMFDR